jgi:hypothetical protein
MKKFVLIVITMFAFIGASNAQYDVSNMDTTTTEPVVIDFYVAGGLSIGNSGGSTFSATSYPSLEFGLMRGNWALGLVAGRGSNDFSSKDYINNYWWSIKNAVYFPVGNSDMDFYALFAVGNYMSTKTVFIEYGGGFSYMPTDHLGLFIQASNWEKNWYITPGISYSF